VVATVRVSIKDVAARAGVSFQTTSKVLNGGGSVSSETRQRILDVATELGYVPNAVARSLVSRSTCTIGVVAGDLSDYVLAQFVVGAEREARRQGHCVVIGSIDPYGEDGERYVRMLLERRVDGILLAAPQMEENPRVGEIVRGRIPAVSIHHVPGGGVSTVGSDHAQTGYLATSHLLGLGRRRVATITVRRTRRVSHSRLAGYRRALDEAGVPDDPALVEDGTLRGRDPGDVREPACSASNEMMAEVEGGYDATHRLLRRASEIDAIFAQTDMMAVGVLSALHDLGRRVPDDCAVVGCDDIPIAARTVPPLTTIHLPVYETGNEAMRLLLRRIAEPSEEPERVTLPVHLIQRVSCGAARAMAAAGGLAESSGDAGTPLYRASGDQGAPLYSASKGA
jgi:LacI family transcriptional regulator